MEYIAPFITLIICIITFHLLLIKFFPQNKKFWKKIDYLWISIGIIGIYGSTFSIEKEDYDGRIPMYTNYFLSSYDNYLNSINIEREYYYNEEKYIDKQNSIELEKYIQAEKLFDSLIIISQYCKVNIFEKKQLNYLDTLINLYNTLIITSKNKYFNSNLTFIPIHIDLLKKHRDDINIAIEKSSRSQFNFLLFYFSPYIFAVAMAIRITKVTADIKEST